MGTERDRKQIDKMQTLFLVVFGATVPAKRHTHTNSSRAIRCDFLLARIILLYVVVLGDWILGWVSTWLNGKCHCEILKKFACAQIENVSNVKQSRHEVTPSACLHLCSTNWICSTVCGVIKAVTLRACPACPHNPSATSLGYFMSSPRSAVNMLGKQPARRLRQGTVHGPRSMVHSPLTAAAA